MSLIKDNLYLGCIEDILTNNWEIIISILTEKEYQNIEGFMKCESYHFEVTDSVGGVEQILQSFPRIEKIIKENKNKKILVHCNLGRSRSPTIIIMYLINNYYMSQTEAYLYVNQQRKIRPNPYFMEMLDDF